MTLLTAFFYNYSLYAIVLSVCWLIGLAANILISKYIDNQDAPMPNLSSSLFISITTGLGVVIYELFFLALFHVFNLQAILLICFLHVILSVAILFRAKVSWKASFGLTSGSRVMDWIWMIPLFIFVCGFLMMPLRPPMLHDEISYHLPYAKFFLQNNGLAVNEYLRYPLNTFNFQLFYSVSLALSDFFLTHIFHGGCALLIALGIFGICRSLYDFWSACLAVVIFLSFKIVRVQMGSAHMDLGLTLFVFSSIFALMLWRRTKEKRWLILSAFFLGISMGSKYTGLVFSIPLGVWVLIYSKSVRHLIFYALISAVFGLPWYVWNFYVSGNPVHPFASDIFGYFIWSAEDMARQVAELRSHGVQRTLVNFLSLPYSMTFTNSFLNQMSIWSLPFFLSPFLVHRLDRTITAPLLTVWFYVVFWFFSAAQILRYMMPVFPVISIVSSLIAVGAAMKIIRLFPVKLSNKYVKIAGQLVICIVLSIYTGKITGKEIRKAQKRPFDKPSIEKFLSEKNKGYELMQFANTYPALKDQPVYQLGLEGSIYFFDGKIMGDWFGPASYLKVWSQHPDKVEENLKKLGAKAIIINNKRFGIYSRESFGKVFELIKENQFGSLYITK